MDAIHEYLAHLARENVDSLRAMGAVVVFALVVISVELLMRMGKRG